MQSEHASNRATAPGFSIIVARVPNRSYFQKGINEPVFFREGLHSLTHCIVRANGQMLNGYPVIRFTVRGVQFLGW